MKIESMNTKWMHALCFVTLCGVAGCDSDNDPQPIQEEPKPTVRDLPVTKFEHPATWHESPDKTVVNEIVYTGDEFYSFYITTLGQKRTQVVGRTETKTIRRDYTYEDTHSIYVNDMYSIFCVGGIDNEDNYASKEDLDVISIWTPPDDFGSSMELEIAPTVDLHHYRTQFSSMSYGAWDFGGVSYFVAGNAYDDGNTVHPFIATFEWDDDLFGEDIITATTFFENEEGIEFLKIDYKLDLGLLVYGYDSKSKEVVVMMFNHDDPNEDHIFQDGEHFDKAWEKRFSMTIDKDLFNPLRMEEKLLLAGTVKIDDDDTAGQIISLDALTGDILQDTVLDLSDENDGFFGICYSGQNLFAYGYTEKVFSGSTPVTSKGWALKLSDEIEPMVNHTYEEEGAVIEITAAIQAHGNANWGSFGKVVVAGTKSSNGHYVAFATEFEHDYRD